MNREPSGAKPKYWQIHERIQQQIKRGELQPGDSIDPERILAEKYGVSRITVRGALTELTREGYLIRVQGKGTYVAEPKEETPVNANIVHVIYNGFHDPESDGFLSHFIGGLSEKLTESGRDLVLISLPQGRTFLSHLIDNDIPVETFSNIIFCGTPPTDDEIRMLRDNDVAMVLIGRPTSREPLHYIEGDHEGGGYQLTKHMLEHGYRRIALQNGPYSFHVAVARLEGFRRAHEDAGVPVDEELLIEALAWNADSGMKTAQVLIDRDMDCDAIISYGDWATFGLVTKLREQGITIPDDIPLAMGDHYSWLDKAIPQPMTALAESKAALAHEALAVLQALRDDGVAGPLKRTIPLKLTIRESCGCKK